jgi:hypothetical protein
MERVGRCRRLNNALSFDSRYFGPVDIDLIQGEQNLYGHSMVKREQSIMILDPALIHACAPRVAVQTIQKIVEVESDDDLYALNINGAAQHPASRSEAVSVVETAMREGKSVDMGYMQVNSRNLAWLGYAVADMFEPCTNLSHAQGGRGRNTWSASRSNPYTADITVYSRITHQEIKP